jgi:hypothetical protein
MRTQFLYVGLLSTVVAGGLVSAGCDDIHTGQLSDPSGPVKLVRVVVQEPSGDRGLITDLLDKAGTPLSTAVACDVNLTPCAPNFTLDGNQKKPDGTPLFSCDNSVCNDPLAPGPVAISPAATVGPNQIRLVFSKLLDVTDIETVTIDPNKAPGKNATYTFQAGMVQLDGPNNMEVATEAFWDPTGSPTNTSDPINVPFGPAIVMNLGDSLAPKATYTVKILKPEAIKDRKGNPLADLDGNPITTPYSITFTTETLAAAATLTPNIKKAGAEIKPDAVLQASFQVPVVEDMSPTMLTNVDCTGSTGPSGPISIYAYNDRADDPTMCKANLNPNTLNFVLVDGTGAVIDWPAGSYSVSCKITDAVLGTDTFNFQGTFSVTGAADPMDPQSRASHVLPAACTG